MKSTDPRLCAAYSEGAGIYRILPRAVVIPETPDELSLMLRREPGQAFVPRGAGSGMPGGNVGADVVVDCSDLKGLTLDAERRIARAGPGVTWKEVKDAAGKLGLRLPPDPSSGAFATSGGMVSTNAAGPRSVQSGLRTPGGSSRSTSSRRRGRLTARSAGGEGLVPWDP